METTKQCIGCNEIKSLNEFRLTRNGKQYLAHCNTCKSKQTRLWQESLYNSTDPNDMLETTFYKILQSSRSNAKSKNIHFTLTLPILRELYKKQQGKCCYTNVSMSLRSNDAVNRDPLLISLDRLNPNEDYTPENTVFCCWGCNALKGHHSIDTFYNSLKLFYQGAQSISKL